MTALVSGIVACVFYAASIAAHLCALHEGTAQRRWLRAAMWLAAPALLAHALSWSVGVFGNEG